MSIREPKPPNPPWIPLIPNPSVNAALDWYYSDSNTMVPIRDVSHPTDPKADPNIETQTFGLFSTCNKRMRKSVVKNGISTVFFCTSRMNSVRVLTGYYQIGWYYEVESGDYMLAANQLRFVSPGFRLNDLKIFLEDYPINTFFRLFRYIDRPQATKLRTLLNATPNATSQYLEEIARLSRLEPFTWSNAARVMRLPPQTGG